MLISNYSNIRAKRFIACLNHTMLPLLFSLAFIALLGFVTSSDARAQEDTTLLNGNPNEIHTVLFSVTDHMANVSYQDVGLKFWVRECTSCVLSGLVTSDTLLINVDGTSIPIRLLRKNHEYEADAIIYAKGSGEYIERILLSEPL